MKTKILAIFAVAFLGPLQALGSSEYCDINENMENSEMLLAQDPAVKEFLRQFPAAKFNPPRNIDESDPEQTSASYTSGVLQLELRIAGYDIHDVTRCFVPIGYRLNSPYLSERIGLDYDKDAQTIIDLIESIKPEFGKKEPEITKPTADRACEDGLLVNGMCLSRSSEEQEMDTGAELFREETISNTYVITIMETIGPSLIVVFIVIYAIKKKKEGNTKPQL